MSITHHRGSMLVLAALSLTACAPSGVRVGDGAPEEPFEPVDFVGVDDEQDTKWPDAAPQWELEPPMADSAGIGTLEISGGTDLTAQLDLASVHIDAHVSGHLVAYEVEHRFDNPTSEVLEGTFRFPLPDGAVVTGLAMEIDGTLMEGEVLEKERARKIYQDIVDSMQDPALLEWEQGNTFKLRVFPIEPESQKRVVLRYLAPLHRSVTAYGEQWQVVVPTAAPTLQGKIGRLLVRVDDEIVRDQTDVAPMGGVRVAVGEAPASVGRQTTPHGTFTSVSLSPDWTAITAPERGDAPRRLIVVMDTSRSALDSWGLAREALHVMLQSLGPADEFTVLASDLSTRPHASGFVGATPDAVVDAMAFIDGIEPDGASDLGAALDAVEASLASAGPPMTTQVVVLGDGVPTWGETDPESLLQHAERSLGDVPLHAMVLGRGADGDLLRRIGGRTGGRVERPQSSGEAEWFAAFLDVAPRLRRVRDVTLVAADPHQVAKSPTQTIFEGQRPVAYIRTASEDAAPTAITLVGASLDGAWSQTVSLAASSPMPGLDKQWAFDHVRALEQNAETRDEVIQISEQYGVLSRHTAFLVLESDAAYREHKIERRRAAEQAAPTISGRDLGEGGEATLRPGDIQPGDPEILIPAPEDARRVVVVFPFGETKLARWDATSGKWIVRFLVDEGTAAGQYTVAVRVTLADGSVKRMTAEYTVDLRAPEMAVSVVHEADGAITIIAEQETGTADEERQRLGGVGLPLGGPRRVLDSRAVEAHLPDGTTLSLERESAGRFVGRWEPQAGVRFPIRAEFVTTDRALNSRRFTRTLSPVTP